MSWADTTRDVVNSLILELQDRSLSQIDQDRLTTIMLDRDRIHAWINDPPGIGGAEAAQVGGIGAIALLLWGAQRFNCLYWIESASVGRFANLVPICAQYLEGMQLTLNQIGETAAAMMDPPTMWIEAVRSQADALINMEREAANIAGLDQSCPLLIEFPAGFGDSCDPKFPTWLKVVIGVWVGSKVLGAVN